MKWIVRELVDRLEQCDEQRLEWQKGCVFIALLFLLLILLK